MSLLPRCRNLAARLFCRTTAGSPLPSAIIIQRHSTLSSHPSKHDPHATNEEQFNEPSGSLFNLRHPSDTQGVQERLRDYLWRRPATLLFLVFYVGGTAVFLVLWQYKPETSSEEWAKREAVRRMKKRGIELDEAVVFGS